MAMNGRRGVAPDRFGENDGGASDAVSQVGVGGERMSAERDLGRFASADYDAIEALGERVATGDTAASRQLLVALDPLVRGEARRQRRHACLAGLADEAEVEDLEQEARLELWRLMPTYDPSRGPALAFFRLRLRGRLRKYVEGLSRRRWPGRRVSWEDGGAEAVADALGRQMSSERVGQESREVTRLDLHEAMATLVPRHQRILALTHWRQVDQATIARLMGISEPAVRQLHRRALDALRARVSRWHYSA